MTVCALFSRLRREQSGVAAMEFAILTPVFMMLIMGLSDLSFQIYAQSILNGAVQKAGRDSGIQGGATSTAAIDAKVIAMIGTIVQNPAQSCATTPPAGASWCSVRKNYDNFTNIKPEPFTDTNGNGQRDPGECYSDINGNGQWDADAGANGQGGADDVAVYSITIVYPRIFSIAGLFGWSNQMTIKATTILKNQPYANQTTNTPVTICT